jgi:hypothetical protein
MYINQINSFTNNAYSTKFKAIVVEKGLGNPQITDSLLEVVKPKEFPVIMFKNVGQKTVSYVLFGNTADNENKLFEILKAKIPAARITKSFIDITSRKLNNLSELTIGELRKLGIKKAGASKYIEVQDQNIIKAIRIWKFV